MTGAPIVFLRARRPRPVDFLCVSAEPSTRHRDEVPAMMRSDHFCNRPPLWLRLLVGAVALWLAVRIVGNVTDSLTGIAHGIPPAPVQYPARGV